jgi:hypothetical protein
MADTDFDRMKVMLGEKYPTWLEAHKRSLERKIGRCEIGTNDERKKIPKIKKVLKVVQKELIAMEEMN